MKGLETQLSAMRGIERAAREVSEITRFPCQNA